MSWTLNLNTCVTGALSPSDQIPVNCVQTEQLCEKHPSGNVISSAMATTDVDGANDPEELWVFGYGSLVWKVDFPVVAKQTGFIKGFRRRFYQHSIDHRGTTDKVNTILMQLRVYLFIYNRFTAQPGRVVTLIPTDEDDAEARVYGVAYRIANDQKEDVIKHLDFREKNGYVRNLVDFFVYPEQPLIAPRRICIYVATPDNESFAGPVSMSELAEQIWNAEGPSGTNREYVFRLAEAMRALFPDVEDDHLYALEAELLKKAS